MRLPVEITEAIDDMILAATWAPYPAEGSYKVRIVPADDEKRVQEAAERLRALIARHTDAGASEAAEDAAIRALLDDDEGEW